ncbi:MAG: FixH family protein [Chloroflexi bacterium]|nr:FixH family protein [Chloroflexota bacterium]
MTLSAATTGPVRIGILALVLALVAIVISTNLEGKTASAHGKELALFVSALAPDESEPLRRLFRLEVLFAGDLDRVEGADVQLSGFRTEGGEDLGRVSLTELGTEQGVYVGEVLFTRFGDWNIKIDVTSAFSAGEGSTTFIESVRPVILSDAEESSLQTEAARVRQLQLFFSFGLWPDIVSIVLRVLHSVSSVASFGLLGTVLLAAWLGESGRNLLRGPVGKYFLRFSLLGLLGLLATGLYGAAFDAPNGAPGIYDVKDLLELPYSEAYLAAFLVKPLMLLVLVVFAFRVNALIVRPARILAPAEEASGFENGYQPTRALRRLTFIGGTVALLLVADIAVLIYIHYISHLGVFLPPGS